MKNFGKLSKLFLCFSLLVSGLNAGIYTSFSCPGTKTVGDTLSTGSGSGTRTGSWSYTSGNCPNRYTYDVGAYFTRPDGTETNSGNLNMAGTWTYHITEQRESDCGGGSGSGGDSCTFTVVSPTPTYTVTVRAGSNGSVSGGGTGVSGSSHNISASANANYHFTGWARTSGSGGSFTNASAASTSYRLGSSNVTVTASFAANNSAPTIEWHTYPTNNTVSSGSTYYVRAKGRDADGNLKTVKVWKAGTPLAFTSVSGTEGVSDNNSTSDTGPKTVRFSAQAVDQNNVASGIIYKDITISAPPPTYTVTVRSADTNKGTVSGGGTGVVGAVKSISASAKSGYIFDGWTKTSGSAGSFQSSSSATTNYTIGAGNVTVTAGFKTNSYTVTVRSADTNKGTVTGGGTGVVGAVKSISASAKSGYIFDGWTKTSGSAGSFANAGSSTTNYTIGAGDVTVTAGFKANTYTVTVSAGSHGSASGGGSGTAGTKKAIRATADSGYHFTGWEKKTGTAGSFVNSGSASTDYTIGVGDVTVEASFAISSYELTVTHQTGGSASGSGTFKYDTSHTITATPNTNYRFTGWTKVSGSGSIANAGNTSTTFTMGGGDATVRADFASMIQAAVSSSGGTITFGQSFTPVVTGGNPTGLYQVSWGNNSSWGDVSAYTPSAAGSYNFWVKRLASKNYYESAVAGPYVLTVNKAAQAVVRSNGGTINYLQSFMPTATGGSGDGAYKIRWDDPESVGVDSGWQDLARVTPSKAGSYTYKVKREESDNYLERVSTTYTLVVNKIAQAAVSASNGSIDYLQSYTPSPSGGSGTGAYQMSWGNNSSWTAVGPIYAVANAPGTAITKYPSAGTYYYYVKRLGDDNYNESAVSARYSLVVNKIAQAAVSSQGGTIATGDSFTVVVNGGTGGGDRQVSWDNKATWSATLTQTHNTAGTFDFWVHKTGDANYLEQQAGAYQLRVVDPVDVSISARTDATESYQQWFNPSDPEQLDTKKMP